MRSSWSGWKDKKTPGCPGVGMDNADDSYTGGYLYGTCL